MHISKKLKHLFIIFGIIAIKVVIGSEKNEKELKKNKNRNYIIIFDADNSSVLPFGCVQPIQSRNCCSKAKIINELKIQVIIYIKKIDGFFKTPMFLPLKYFMDLNHKFKKDGDIIEIENQRYILKDEYSSLEKWYKKYHESYSCVIL